MDLTITPIEVVKAAVGAATAGALAIGVLARHMSKVERILTGRVRPDPGAPPMTPIVQQIEAVAAQLRDVGENTAHTAGAVDQLSDRLEALEGRLEESARDHAQELRRVKGRLEGIEGHVKEVTLTVHTIAGRVDGLERDRGWARRAHGRDIPISGTEG